MKRAAVVLALAIACAHRPSPETSLGLAREAWVSYDTAFTDWFKEQTVGDDLTSERYAELKKLHEDWSKLADAMVLAFGAAQVAVDKGQLPSQEVQYLLGRAVVLLRSSGIPIP